MISRLEGASAMAAMAAMLQAPRRLHGSSRSAAGMAPGEHTPTVRGSEDVHPSGVGRASGRGDNQPPEFVRERARRKHEADPAAEVRPEERVTPVVRTDGEPD